MRIQQFSHTPADVHGTISFTPSERANMTAHASEEQKAQSINLREGIEAEAKCEPDNGEEHARQNGTGDLPNLPDRYEVLEQIGHGGMGSVYKVYDKAVEKVMAIKVLQPELTKDAAALKRFEQEAESASELNHSNLVSVYGHGTSLDGAPYIVMDFIDGPGLAAILKKEHHLEPKRALDIFIKICEGLIYAHDRNVIHRDIKPTNIIMTRTADGADSAHIVDFGIAK